MIELAQVVRKHGPEYLAKFGDRMPHNHKRAIAAIAACRTEEMGGHLEECDHHCGHFDYAYHSCKNSSCPKCHGADTNRWFAKREAELLPVSYFHLVFTLPAELREVVRSNQKALYAVLFEAAITALAKLGLDRKYLGGRLGMVAVLHTWTRAKEYHPQLHLLVPGGALDKDGVWRPARRKFLVPVKALSPIFRAIFMKRARKALPAETFHQEVWDQDWVVFSRPTFKKTKKVLTYLSRYVYRVAIANNSIIALENDHVTFRYQNADTREWKTMRLTAMEFLRRFLQHVLPKGFHKVRYFGFLHPTNKVTLKRLQLLLWERDRNRAKTLEQEVEARTEIVKVCPCCKEGIMVVVSWLPRRSRSPPPGDVKKMDMVVTMRRGQKQVAGVTLYERPLQGKTEQSGTKASTGWNEKRHSQVDKYEQLPFEKTILQIYPLKTFHNCVTIPHAKQKKPDKTPRAMELRGLVQHQFMRWLRTA